MMLCCNTCFIVYSPDGDWEFFEKIVGIIHGETLAPFTFIICLDYVLKDAPDKIQNLSFTLTK